MNLSVVMPAYNEEPVIEEVLKRLIALDLHSEILVVDDGSTDRTAEVAQRVPGVRVIQQPYNMGNGAAVKAGIRAATGDLILLMDADGQHPPEEIPNLLQHIDQYDMVVGARNAETQQSTHRLLANQFFNKYAAYIVGRKVPDLTSGFRIIRTPVAKEFVNILPNGFSYPTTITIALFTTGYTVKYQPFLAPKRVGESKIRPLRDGIRFLLTLTRLAVFFVPFKIFLPISLFFVIPGAFYVALQLVAVGRFSGFGSLTIILGVLFFVMGLISEQIALLRISISGR